MSSGLFVFDRNNSQILLLQRKNQYEKCLRWRSRPEHYVEQYYIPRGRRINRNEPLLICAIREFIEETHIYLKKINFISTSYELIWEDPPGKPWKYEIFFAEGSLSPDNLLTIHESFDVDLNGVEFNLKNCDFSSSENGSVLILSYSEYFNIIKKQMTMYHKSNYAAFIELVRVLL